MNSTQVSDDSVSHELRRHRMRRRWVGGIVTVFIVAGFGYGSYWYLVGRYFIQTDDAYVSGNQLSLTPQIAGTVISIAADDTDLVLAGQSVVKLDRSNATVAIHHAEAAPGAAVRAIRKLRQQASAERARIRLRRIQLKRDRQDYYRDKHLVTEQGVTLQQFQHAEASFHGAQQRLRYATHRLASLMVQMDAPTILKNPTVQLAVANLHQAWLDLKRTSILAPITGYVAQRRAQIGERVTTGQPLLSIIPLRQIWVDANFKETDISRLRIGQPVSVTADEYGTHVVYRGRIAGISAGTGSAFELLPPQNATGNWIKIVRRVPVRIQLRLKQLRKHPLRIGLSMSVTVNTHDLSGPVLALEPPPEPVYHTNVYAQAGHGFRALVRKILRENGVKASQNEFTGRKGGSSA